jgi:hypothetical protein
MRGVVDSGGGGGRCGDGWALIWPAEGELGIIAAVVAVVLAGAV